MVFDCAEGSLSNIVRLLRGEARVLLRNVRAIWVSHAHLDHIAGLDALLRAIREAWGEELPVASPPVLLIGPSLLPLFLDCTGFGLPSLHSVYSFVAMTAAEQLLQDERVDPVLRGQLGFTTYEAAQVVHHDEQSYAIRLEGPHTGAFDYTGE